MNNVVAPAGAAHVLSQLGVCSWWFFESRVCVPGIFLEPWVCVPGVFGALGVCSWCFLEPRVSLLDLLVLTVSGLCGSGAGGDPNQGWRWRKSPQGVPKSGMEMKEPSGCPLSPEVVTSRDVAPPALPSVPSPSPAPPWPRGCLIPGLNLF